MSRFDLQPASYVSPEGITSRWQLVDQSQSRGCRVLVMSFIGTCPPGSAGSPHALYVAHESLAAVHALSPHALVLDLRELEYRWGDTMLRVFQDISQFMDTDVPRGAPPFPVLLVVSDKSSGILSLVGASDDGSAFVFRDLDSAIDTAIVSGTSWLEW